ncbi:MAG: hypothetical protein O3A01_02975 [bacterium]|nr:hypothetical protein [bacterium]
MYKRIASNQFEWQSENDRGCLDALTQCADAVASAVYDTVVGIATAPAHCMHTKQLTGML